MRKLTFTNSRDESIELGYYTDYLINKIEGLGEVEADTDTVKTPYVDGSTYIDSMLNERDISIDGTFRRYYSPDMYHDRRTLQRIFNPKLGIGTLKYEHGGITRLIDAVADGSPAFADRERDNFQKFQINLLCPNPYWRDQNQVSRALKSYEGYFKLPFKLPFKLGKQGDRTTLVNGGDVPAPVQIDLQGPVMRPEIRNATTGEFIRVNARITEDEILHIDTTPGRKRVEVYSGDFVRSVFGSLDYANGSSFWQLEVGENEVEYYADEGTGKAIVAVSWYNKYVGI